MNGISRAAVSEGESSSPFRPGILAAGAYANLPWQCLYLRPDPHGQGALRATLPQVLVKPTPDDIQQRLFVQQSLDDLEELISSLVLGEPVIQMIAELKNNLKA